MVRWDWLWASNYWVAHSHELSILGMTSHAQLWSCSTMLHTSVNTFDIYVIRHDQTQPDMTKHIFSYMADTFVSDLWGCNSEITQIHVFQIKSCLKGLYHVIIICHQVWEAFSSPIGCSKKSGKIKPQSHHHFWPDTTTYDLYDLVSHVQCLD